MLVKPTVSELLKKVEDRYELVVITSKRARQLEDPPGLRNGCSADECQRSKHYDWHSIVRYFGRSN